MSQIITSSDAMLSVGWVRITARDAVSGLVIHDQMYKNKITNKAKGFAAQLWSGATNITVPCYIAVGTGSPTSPLTTVDPTDTTLWTELSGSRFAASKSVWLSYNTIYTTTYNQGDAIAAWTELGLFDASSGGNLWSHVQLNPAYVKDNTQIVTVQWQITQVGN